MSDKKYYKCKVCGDIHYGVNPPEICPTCKNKNAYFGISKDEAMKHMK